MNKKQPRSRSLLSSSDVDLITPAPPYEEALVAAVDGKSTLLVQVKIAAASVAAPKAFSAKLYPGFFTDSNDPPLKPAKDAVRLLPSTTLPGAFEAEVPTVATIAETNSQQTLVVWPGTGNLGAFKLNITDFGNFVNLTNILPVTPATLNLDGTVTVSLTCDDGRVASIFAMVYPGTIEGEDFPIAVDTGAVQLTQDPTTTTLYTGNVDASGVSAANTNRTLVIWPSDDPTGAAPFTLWYQHISVSP